jgi:hypothetical protein
VDPLAGKTPKWSPFAYVFNNPTRFIDPEGLTGEPVIKGNTVTIKSTFIFYGESEGYAKDIKQDVRRTEKAWNNANAKVEIDGKVYNIRFDISAKIISADTYDEAVEDIGSHNSGTSFIDVCAGCETGIEHGGGRGKFNPNDIMNDARSFMHEYGHENGFTDDSQEDNPSFGHHDEIGLPGKDGRIPGIMTARETAANAPARYGYSNFAPDYTRDGVIDATKRANPTQREVNMLIHNRQELLLEKIRAANEKK